METAGMFAPETPAAARERYESLRPAAQTVVESVARTVTDDQESFQQFTSDAAHAVAADALFAALLEVQVGRRAEYVEWCGDQSVDPVELGSDSVDNVVWHAPQFAETPIAATYQDQREAAVETLRQQAFGRLYREVVR